MGLNLVEAILVAACADLLSRRERLAVSPMELTLVEYLASEVLVVGMRKAGFRYRPGLLRSPYGSFYEGQASLTFLQERASRGDKGVGGPSYAGNRSSARP